MVDILKDYYRLSASTSQLHTQTTVKPLYKRHVTGRNFFLLYEIISYKQGIT